MKTRIIAAAICAAAVSAVRAAPAPAVSAVPGVAAIAEALRAKVLPGDARHLAHDAILAELSAADRAADAAWRNLGSREAFEAHAAALRKNFAEAIGGIDFERTPLNTKTTGKLECDGCRIEKLVFESRPGVYVTACLYLPDAKAFKPPYPGIILTCGHSKDGKNCAEYQRGSIICAQAGFAVLAYDPISQGEREQVPGGFCCEPHNRYGALAALLGQSTARQRLRDGMRAIDCLLERDEVRKDGVGCMGNSGGGTMTSLLETLDPRIVAACPSCYISSLREVCAAIGPQDAEQNVFGQLAFGLNHAGYVLAGGNAVRIHACLDDFFPIAGTRETFSVVRDAAAGCGLDVERYGLTDVPGPHGWKESARISTMLWMRRWLARDPSAPPIDVAKCRELDKGFKISKVPHGPKGDTARAVQGGKAANLPGFRSIYDYLKDDLAAAEKARPAPDAARLAKAARRRAAIRHATETGLSVREAAPPQALDGGATVVREILSFADGRQVPAVFFLPPGGKARGAELVVDDRPDRAIHRNRVRGNLAAGRATIVADLSCTGETGEMKHRFYGMPNADEGPAVMLYMLGRSIVGVRAEELIALAGETARLTGCAPTLSPHGRTCIAAAHAYAVRRDLFTGISCVIPPPSWADSVRSSRKIPFADVVHGALLEYDWTDLLQ